MILKHWWIYCHMFTSHVVTCSRRVAVVLTPFVSNGRGHGDKNFQFPYFDRKFPPHARERKKEKTKAIIRARERGGSVNFRLLNLPVTLVGHYIQPSPQYFVRSSSSRLTLKLSLFSATQSRRVNPAGKAPESLDRSVRRCPLRWLVCSFGQQNKHCHVDTAYWN